MYLVKVSHTSLTETTTYNVLSHLQPTQRRRCKTQASLLLSEVLVWCYSNPALLFHLILPPPSPAPRTQPSFSSSPQLEVLHELLHVDFVQQNKVGLPKLQGLQLRHCSHINQHTDTHSHSHTQTNTQICFQHSRRERESLHRRCSLLHPATR